MDSFRIYGLHLLEEKASLKGVDMVSLGDVVMALTGYQVAESQLYQEDSTWGYLELNDDGNSVSSGNMSPDFRKMWRYGCPKSPDWDGDVELDSVDVGRGGGWRKYGGPPSTSD